MTDVVLYGSTAIGTVVAIDLDILLSRGANTWATWKENEPFEADGSTLLRATIERPENDDRKNAIQFILLHEFGHVLTAGGRFLPDWWINPRDLKAAHEYAFLDAYDDFAECFALYVHTVLMAKPYKIEIFGDTPRVLSDTQSVATRCAAKYEFLRRLLAAGERL